MRDAELWAKSSLSTAVAPRQPSRWFVNREVSVVGLSVVARELRQPLVVDEQLVQSVENHGRHPMDKPSPKIVRQLGPAKEPAAA